MCVSLSQEKKEQKIFPFFVIYIQEILEAEDSISHSQLAIFVKKEELPHRRAKKNNIPAKLMRCNE